MGRRRTSFTKQCPVCGGGYVVQPCNAEERRYCSQTCFGASRRKTKNSPEGRKAYKAEVTRLEERIAMWKQVNEDLKDQLATKGSMRGAY